jgi:PEP-CTERM motif
MKRWTGRMSAAASALFLLTAGPVRADLMPSFSYSWDQSPATIPSDGSGTGSISISVGSGTAVAPSTIVAANLAVISSALAPNMDTYTNKAYQLTLTLTDTASGQTGTFVFNGALTGTANTTSSNFTNVYIGPTTVTDHIGAYNYMVQILPPVVPPITGGITQGGISAQVTAAAYVGGAPVSQTPEPSALILAGLGLPIAAGWRRLRAKARANLS